MTWRALIRGILSVGLLAGGAAAHAASVNGEAVAYVVRRGTVVSTEDLRFGRMYAGATGGTVQISAAGLMTVTGGVTHAGGVTGPAQFVTAGSPNRLITIDPQNGTATLNRVGGGATMTVTNLAPNFAIRLLDGQGVHIFTVGGRLNVAANQRSGNYTGTFTVTVNYF